MNFNKTMVANAKERKALRAAERDTVSRLVLLMNQFHAMDLRYFPSEEKRLEHKNPIEKEIRSLRKYVPEAIKGRIPVWLNDAVLWREELDSVHCLL